MPATASRYAYAVLAFLVFGASIAFAQGDATIGIPPIASRISIPLGFVDALTGQVHLEIPIASVPQRNGVPLRMLARYDTTYYSYSAANGGYVPQNGSGWWAGVSTTNAGSLNVTIHTNYQSCPANYPNGQVTKYDHFRFYDSNGTAHLFPTNMYELYSFCSYTDSNNQTHWFSPREAYYNSDTFSTDGEGYFISGRTVWNRNGTQYPQSNPTVDTNGNTGGQFTQNPMSPNGGICLTSSPFTMSIKVSDGSTQTYTFNCQAYTVGNGAATVYLMSSILLPDGTSYSFAYDAGNTGLLTGVTLPTGGQITFGYASSTQLTSVTYGGSTWNFTGVNLYVSNIAATTSVLGPNRFEISSNTYVRDNTVFTPNPTPPGRQFPQMIQYYSGSSTLLKTESMTYSGYCIASKTTTLNDTGQSSKVALTYSPVSCSLPTQKQEWDFGATTPTRTTKITYIQDTPTIHYNSQYHIYDRPLSLSLYAGDGTTGSPIQSTTFSYDEYAANYCSIPMLTSVPGAVNHDDTNYGSSFWARGNPTSITRAGTAATSVTTHACYDILGNVTQNVDGLGNKATLEYGENWADTFCISAGVTTRAFPTTITDALGHRTQTQYYSCTGLNSVINDENDIRAARSGTTFTWDFLNRPSTITHASGATESYSYNDTSSSFSSTLSKSISSSLNLTEVTSLDSWGRKVQTSISSDPEGPTYTAITYDAVGNRASVYNPTRCNPPTTNCGESTWGVTTYYYDALGRPILQVPPDGTSASNNISTTYNGNCSTVRDQAGKSSKSCSNAFGRVTQIFQDPAGLNFETDYAYDVLNNLISVIQKGNSANSADWRTRTFTYDGLSRVVCASNPENSTAPCPTIPTGSYTPGTVGFTYDANGNMLTRTVPAPNQTGSVTVVATYIYDALNRLTQKSFNDGATPTIKYIYDGGAAPTGCTFPSLTITNPIGRRTGMCDAPGSEVWAYDSVGRVLFDQRKTNNITKQFAYTYNLDGSLATQTHPSPNPADVWPTHTFPLTNTQGGAGRSVSLYNGTVGIAYNVKYTPSGALCFMNSAWGQAWTERYTFNNRLQPVAMQVYGTGSGTTPAPPPCAASTDSSNFNLLYNFVDASGHNNGDVVSITNKWYTPISQSFTYDSLNRLKTAQTTATHATDATNCWAETYNYDAWGNLLKLGADTTNQSAYNGCIQESGFDFTTSTSAKNQITASGYGYDAAGNLTTNPGVGTQTFNAENQLISAGGQSYAYDGDGNRIWKAPIATPNSPTLIYWYGGSGSLQQESDGAGFGQYTHVYFNGRRIKRVEWLNGAWFDHYSYDHLGNARFVYGYNGTWDRSEYYPFGGERPLSSGAGNKFKFTGKERDAESSLYDFGKRFFSATVGRFVSPDNGPFLLSNPDSLNRYTYALDNPLLYLDPDGDTSTVYQLGTVIVNTFAQQMGAGSTFDVSSMLSSLAGPRTVPLKDQQESSSIIEGEQGHYSRVSPKPSAGGAGGCILPCSATFDQVPNAVAISLSFDYDEKTNAITKTNITYSIDQNATFITSDPAPTKRAWQPLPGWTPNPEIASININSNALRNLTSDQLNALFRATSDKKDSVSKAIADAVLKEKKRRATEAEEKAKEEERKKCAASHTSCKQPSTGDAGQYQRP